MRQQTEGRLLATAIAVLLLGIGGTTTLAGCGGSSLFGGLREPTNPYRNKSYVATGIALGTYGAGDLTINVDANGTPTGTLQFFNAQTHALVESDVLGNGYLTSDTGSFSVSGTYASGQTGQQYVSVSGNLPPASATSGGSAQVTVGSVSNTVTLSTSASPSPSPSP